MVDNNGLDSLITDTPATTPDFSSVNASSASVPVRPKLKKIKRPKVRPANISVTPPKVESDMSVSNALSDLNSESTDNPESLEDMMQDTGTSLVTATQAQELTQENERSNPYVLEGLPPDLDYISDEDSDAVYEDSPSPLKKIILTALGCFVLGLLVGAFAFASKTEEKHGLEDVVLNPDVPQGRARCGLTDKTQACIFYVMNCYKQELTGRDFYKLAATLTGREEYTIESENLRYSNVKIKPGAFAQLNIPALK